MIRTQMVALLALSLFAGNNAEAQWQSRNSINATAPLTEKFTIGIGHMRAYNASKSFALLFQQTAITGQYEINKRFDVSGALQFIHITSAAHTRTRFFIRGAHTTKLDRFSWVNSVRLETNSQNERRFRHRIGFGTRLALRNRITVFNLIPSVNYQMFYNIGGNPLRYYSPEGAMIAQQTPDGFHRGRLTINFNSKISDVIRVDVYYMRQQEFNLLTGPTRKMNVTDPVRNRTQRPFNNFNAIGISLRANLEPIIN